MKKPSIKRLREALIYDPETGALTWRHRPVHHFTGKKRPADVVQKMTNSRFAGKPAFTASDDLGRLSGTLFNSNLRAHVAAFAIHHGRWPKYSIDHKDGNQSNNRIKNLRDVPHSVNMKNLKKPSTNTSGVMGVSLDRTTGKWRAYIGKVKLGRFEDFSDAVAARQAAEKEHGFHENHGRQA